MRRRALLQMSLLAGLVGCTPAPDPTQAPSAMGDDHVSVESGDFAILFSNLAAGEDPKSRQGYVSLVSADGTRKGGVAFTPMDNARLFSHQGAVAWLANDAAHHWGKEHRSWKNMPSHGGAVDTLLPADDRILAVINEGTEDPETYESGLFLFDATESQPWKHPGFLGEGVGWSSGVAFGFSAKSLYEENVQLTLLGPGNGQESFGPVIEGSRVWGERIVNLGGHSYALTSLASTGVAAELWQIDANIKSVTAVPLVGPGADVADWYTVAGPSSLTPVGEELFWLSGAGLWAANPRSGETRLVKNLAEEESAGWFLGVSGLVGLRRNSTGWSLRHFNAVDGQGEHNIESITLEGPGDLYPHGAVRIE